MASCDVKLFVAATPISGPQFSPMTTSDSCDSDEFRWLTRDKIFAFDCFAILYKITNKLCDGCMKLDWDNVSKSISETLENHSKIQKLAKILKDVSDIYVLGRGIHFPIAKEAALKLKELTYIHAEGIPGGELKHGPLALMDENVFVIIINPDDSTYTCLLYTSPSPRDRG